MYAAWTGVEETFPGVYLYKNFYSDADCQSIVASAERAKLWISAAIGRYQDNVLVESKVDLDLRDVQVADLTEAGVAFPTPNVETLRQDVVARFDAPIDVMSRGMISKYVVGSHIRAHRDTGVYSTNRLVTCVAYLNDEYVGGALTFPQFGGSISPKRGDCVCFYSELLHGVSEITAGTRYCIVWFGESSLVDTR